MKDSELQELKPVYIHEARYPSSEEISLIDLALILVRYKIMMGVIIVLIIALGVFYALKQPRHHTFSTSIEIGSQLIDDTIQPLSSPLNLLAKLKYNFIPQTLYAHRLSNPEDNIKYNIKPTMPLNSDIIVLEIQGPIEKADLYKNLLNNVSSKAIQDHERIYGSIKQSLTSSLKQAKTEIALLTSDKNNQAERIRLLSSKIDSYNSQIANLHKTREVSPPVQYAEPTGRSRKLIVITAAVAGVFLAVFTAFFTEFVIKVKEKYRKSSSS